MEYTLSQAETILLAKGLIAKGKSEHFIKETLSKRGANPEHVLLIIAEVAMEKESITNRDRTVGIVFIICGTVWILTTHGLGLMAYFGKSMPRMCVLTIAYGPAIVGILWSLKGIFKISKMP